MRWSWSVFWWLVTLIWVLGVQEIQCTSSQILHNLLRHPHYADKHHQHAIHSQPDTSHPNARTFDGGRSSSYSSGPPSPRAREEGALWQRTAPKEYYKMNGYPVKSTSATKGAFVDASEMPQELLEVREANEHFVRMRSGARCLHPRPQVVCVRDVYPEKEFLPRCTLLHRCTETSGCCEDDTKWCAPKAMQEVALHFYVLGGDHRSSDVQKLLFVNHTECECKTRAFVNATSPPMTTTSTPDFMPKKVIDHFPQGDQNRKCRSCPSPFCVRELEDGRCACDCFDKQRPCIRIKRGREALPDSERRCVLAGHCNIPDCDHGAYDPENGRCPKKPDHENFKGFENGRRPHPSSRNPNHRWNYFERD